MKSHLIAVCLICAFIAAAGCKKQDPANPPAPSATETRTMTTTSTIPGTATMTVTPTVSETATMSETATITPTATNTRSIIPLDDFEDGDLVNKSMQPWNEYYPNSSQWVSAPSVSQGIYGYGIKVTGYATAAFGSPGAYFGYFGTSTNFMPIPASYIYINFAYKLIPNVPGGNAGSFNEIRTLLQTGSGSSIAEYDLAAGPAGVWNTAKININDFTFLAGNISDLLANMNIQAFFAVYNSTVLNEPAETELYLDDIYFSVD